MGSEMTEIQVEVIHKETITPASPTPRNLTTCNLSVFDQFISDVYVRLLLFYPSSDVAHRHTLFTDRSKLRKTSLSEALSRFYPYAGRTLIQNNIVSICCNEQGAAFIEARVNCPISKVLEKPDLGLLKQLLPTSMESTQESTGGYLLLVQANFFECGGVAIGVSISHKAADASTLGTFISSWAAVALGAEVEALPAAEFGVAASNYPQLNFFNKTSIPAADYVYEACRTRKFVFMPQTLHLSGLKLQVSLSQIPRELK